MADENSLAILLIHHLRKASAEDELDLVTGSTGLTGAADSVAIFSRKRMAPEATLFVAPRDFEESNLALSFDKSTLSWTLLGQAEEYHMSKERQEIIKVLESANGPLKLKEICVAVGKKEPVVHKLLGALVDSGFAEQPAYGFYQLVKTGETGESGKSGENADNGETGSKEAETQNAEQDFDTLQ